MPRNAPEGVFSTPAANKPRLLDHVRERLRYLHYSLRTERAYADWIKRYILYPCTGSSFLNISFLIFYEDSHPEPQGESGLFATGWFR